MYKNVFSIHLSYLFHNDTVYQQLKYSTEVEKNQRPPVQTGENPLRTREKFFMCIYAMYRKIAKIIIQTSW